MEYSILEVAKMLIIKNTENYDEWIEYVADRLVHLMIRDIIFLIRNKKI
jgi:hypothetical protein